MGNNLKTEFELSQDNTNIYIKEIYLLSTKQIKFLPINY